MSCAGQVALSEPVTMSETAQELESVVRTHARLVFRVAYSVLRNREDAEDAAQETYIRLMRQDLRKIEDPRLWLARVAWRVAVDRVRKHPEQSLDADDQYHEIAASGPTADQTMLEAELQAQVEKMIEALPRALREAVRLSTVEEMTSADVAQVLGIPEGTVRTRMSRARQMLRDKLATYIHPNPRNSGPEIHGGTSQPRAGDPGERKS
jgi:RNA polymerase sigma-70 factor (ECF subfamily)